MNLHFKAAWSSEKWDKALTIWENASISILDIRHRLIEGQTSLQEFKLPAHAFLFALNGPGILRLGEIAYEMERFAMLHLCKGTKISIDALGGWLDFYLILYQPSYNASTFTSGRNIESNPLLYPLAVSVSNPLFYANCFRSMHDQWQHASNHRQLHAKSGFYQLVEQLSIDCKHDHIAALPLDIVQNAIAFMGQNYHLSLTIQGIAESFGISSSQLNRLFKQKLNVGPLEYLKELRIQAAKRYLELYPVSLKEVASATGICDEFYLSRLIKQRFNRTAEQLKQKFTSRMRDMYMEQEDQFPYTHSLSENNYHYQNKGEQIMLNKWKSKLLLTGALSVMLTVTACGNNTGANNAQTNKIPEESSPSAETRIVTTEMGNVEIPIHPQRIIIPYQQGDLLALGIKPVGTSFNDDAVFQEEMGDTAIGIPWETDLEAIMALEPDLIIYTNEEDYDKLSLIAPTVIIPKLYSLNPLERLTLLADLVGKAEKAEELIAQFHKKVADSKLKLEQGGLMDKTVALIEFNEPGSVFIYGNKYGRGGELLYNYLGIKAPQKVIDDIIEHPKDPRYLEVSKEVMADYQGDFIFSDKNWLKMENDPIWKSLTAVKEGKVIQTNSGMFWFNDILSLNAQLEFITEQLLEHAKK
ncbi:AraC family transcriptional regulator [Cohnella abietis]|uniref:AraC family transcriptional regulator n=1 Tax=Cohnella abietis TaxID=2507935 RepID=UPI00102EB7FB|nr:AraC family transcriptional regulator [Cohnella abietis]